MKEYKTIKKEIGKKTSILEDLKDAYKKSKYEDNSFEKFGMFFPFLFVIAIAPLYFLTGKLFETQFLVIIGIVLSPIWLFILVEFFISVCRAFERDIAYSAAWGFFIFWAAVFISDVFSLVLFFSHWLPENTINAGGLFNIDLSGHIDISTFPVYFINDRVNAIVLKYWVGTVFLSTLQTFIIFLASLIRLIIESAKRKKCNKDVERIAAQIKETETAIQKLNEESARIIKEANESYAAEIQKENPNREVMIQLAESGCANAGLWVALELAQGLIAERGSLSKEATASTAKKIQYYVQLADGCAQQDLCDVLDVWSFVYSKQYGLSSYASSRNKLDELKDMKKRASKLASGKQELVRIFAEEANAELQDGITKAEKALNKKEAEEAEKKRKSAASSYSGGYSGSYSGSYSSSRLSDSELRDLNNKITGGLWNPSAIDNSNLTESQKQQLKDYNRIYGD